MGYENNIDKLLAKAKKGETLAIVGLLLADINNRLVEIRDALKRR